MEQRMQYSTALSAQHAAHSRIIYQDMIKFQMWSFTQQVYVPERERLLMLLYHLDKSKYYPVTKVEWSVNNTSNEQILDKNGAFERGQISRNVDFLI